MAEDNTAKEMDDDSDLPEEVEAGAEVKASETSEENQDADVKDETTDSTTDEENSEAGSAESVSDAPESDLSSTSDSIREEVTVIEPPAISSPAGDNAPIADISMLLDIPVTLSMEIGNTRISINDLLKLGKDSVIELQRMADEPLDVLVNGTLIAHGEAVVVGERFGIRLTDVISPQERLSKVS